tara:strand:+ start:56 stop:382 length:327 start_codon:yes stop_codon:yes gene_type:complete
MEVVMSEFEKALKGHDWYYAYSDDHSYWSRGVSQARSLNIMHNSLNCPYSMSKLQSWVFNMTKDTFAEEEPGKWYRIPREKYAASVQERELLTAEEYSEISEWFKKNK